MKGRLSLVVLMVLSGVVSALNADELSESLKNGKISGDVTVTYESRNVDRQIGAYYADTAYSVGSIGLNYETAKFYNFSANVGMRAYQALWQDDSKFITSHGKGDASERFYEDGSNKHMELANAYLAYTTQNILVKAGRQELSTEWLTKYHDAVTAMITPLDKAQIEMIYSSKRYRVDPREFFSATDINGNDGIYKLGLSYNITDAIKAKAYTLIAPDNYDIYGGKVNLDSKINDIGFGGLTHYMETRENIVADGKMVELVGYASYAGYKATIGYVKTGKENGWGSAANYGDTVVPFEEGDHMYVADARTTYLMLSKTIADISLTGLYGVTKYGQFSKDEFDIWASYKFSKNLSGSLGLAITNEDKNDGSVPDLTQLNATLAYKF